MKTPLIHLLLTFTLVSAANLPAQSHSLPFWTSNDDRAIQARFIGVGAQSVLIEKDGVVFNVPFARLSALSIAQAKRLGEALCQQAPAKPEAAQPQAVVAMVSVRQPVPTKLVVAKPQAVAVTVRVSRPPMPTRAAALASRSVVVAAASVRQPVMGETGLRRLPSEPEWNFLQAYQQGDDVVVHHTTATVFGHDTELGVTDPNDNGRCASGRGTKDNPGIMGCALPVSLARRSTVGSPFAKIPGLPWFSKVEVTHKGKSITVQLIDNGPSAPAPGDPVPAGIDLTPAACLALGIPLEDIRGNRAVFQVSFRLLGAGRLAARNDAVAPDRRTTLLAAK